MSNFNINVQVGGPMQAPSTYKTVVLKGNVPLGLQMTEPNTKYVIRWDFDLDGETVTVPENCILEFDGGSLNNGTIIGQDTVFINVGDVTIWRESLTRLGTWREHSGGGGEPDAYLKSAEVINDGNTLILTDKDDNAITFTPEGSGEQVKSDWEEDDPNSPAYIEHKPNLGTAAFRDVPESGNASNGQVVLGSDSRLSNSRPASDVPEWAKQPNKPSYNLDEVPDGDTRKLSNYIPLTQKGVPNGVATLDGNGKVPASQLPGGIDSIVEGYYNPDDGKFYEEKSGNTYSGEITPESNKIYLDLETNKQYRWSGTQYVEISSSLALGTTHESAYYGDLGNIAYDHSLVRGTGVATSNNPHGISKTDVGLGNVGNYKAVSTAASQGLSDTEKGNARTNIGAGTSNFSGNYGDLINKPTGVSAFDNDAGYLTSHQDISGKADKSNTYTKEEVNNIISAADPGEVIVIDVFPSAAELLTTSSTENGYFDDSGQVTANNNYTIKKYAVEDLSKIYFSGELPSGSDIPFAQWCDSGNNRISTEPYHGSLAGAVSYTMKEVVPPQNAAYLYLNTYNSASSGDAYGVSSDVSIDVAAALEQLVPNIIDPVTGQSSRYGKLYRVSGPNNDSYSEWAWDGTGWVMLDNKDYGIDDIPTPESENLVKSGGITDVYGKYQNNYGGLVDATLDKEGKLLMGFYKDGAATIPGLGLEITNDALERIDLLIDKVGRILSYRLKDGTLVEPRLRVTDSLEVESEAFLSLRDNIAGPGIDAVSDADDWDIATGLNKLAAEKADSMALLAWTPKKDCPQREEDKIITYFPAGTEVLGVPYGATYELDKCIGFDVSLETFMTAVNNPYSLLYTEICTEYVADPTASNPNTMKSDWGETYHGIRNFAGPYFGSVCSEFTGACLGLNAKLQSEFMLWTNKDRYTGKIHPQSAQGVRVGDILIRDGHDAVIKAVRRNDVGTVVEIIVAEQAGTAAYETSYTEEEFDARIMGHSDTIVRDVSLPRTDTPFTFDAEKYRYNNDICTFAGNNACFLEGDRVVINFGLHGHFEGSSWITDYTSTSKGVFELIDGVDGAVYAWELDNERGSASNKWTYIELYKDGELFGTPYEISQLNTNLPASQKESGSPRALVFKKAGDTGQYAQYYEPTLGYGHYMARLTDGVHNSEGTEFDIIQATVTVNVADPVTQHVVDSVNYVDVGNLLDISFSSVNATPISMKLAYDNEARNGGVYVFSDEEIRNGRAIISLDYFRNQDRFSNPDTLITTAFAVKVFFSTDTGKVCQRYEEIYDGNTYKRIRFSE